MAEEGEEDLDLWHKINREVIPDPEPDEPELIDGRVPGIDPNYHAYGEGVQMFKWLTGEVEAPREAMFEGVAGCGKTRLIGEWVKALCNQFPKSVGLVIRKTRVSLNESFLEIFENEVLGDTHPAVVEGPSRKTRDQYQHEALGGRIVLGGMDNPVRLFSTQYHWCYVNEMQELTEEEWESLHRALRRRGLPFRPILIGDCNPEDEYHWANQRAKRGTLHRMVGRFTDNPTVTREYLERLRDNLTGVRYKRLFLGQWVSAEGQIYEEYEASKHLLSARMEFDEDRGGYWMDIDQWSTPDDTEEDRAARRPYLSWFVAGMDFGYAAPGCFQIWGVDQHKRMWRVAEVYRAEWDLDRWANAIETLYKEFPFRVIVCDSAEPRSIKFLNDRLGPIMAREVPRIAIPAEKHSKVAGKRGKLNDFNQVRWLIRDDNSLGTPRLFFVRDALRFGRCPKASDKGQPGCSEEEIVAYVHPKVLPGRELTATQKEDSDKLCADHGMDCMRYVASYIWGKDFTPTIVPQGYRDGTFGALLGDAKTLWEKEKKSWRRS